MFCPEEGIRFSKAYLYGSQARGTATEDSDIDLMIVSPLFDENTDKYAPVLLCSGALALNQESKL